MCVCVCVCECVYVFSWPGGRNNVAKLGAHSQQLTAKGKRRMKRQCVCVSKVRSHSVLIPFYVTLFKPHSRVSSPYSAFRMLRLVSHSEAKGSNEVV